MNKELKVYEDIRLLNIEDDSVSDWPLDQATHVRVTLPWSVENQMEMKAGGYFHADRMICASIPLGRNCVDFSKFVRLTVKKTSEGKEKIKEIACNAFAFDRRFHVGLELNMQTAQKVINGWFEDIHAFYVCYVKEIPAGFMVIKEHGTSPKKEIFLAATDEKYRAAGVALSMYAYAAQQAKEEGAKALFGYISSMNMPVLNIYSFLGAAFSSPKDVFLKEL